MEKLSAKELRHSLNCLLETIQCPVCLNTLQPASSLCVNGHAICVSCQQHLQVQECPTCRGQFSNVQPTGIIRQIIQSLPHACRFQDCSYFVKTNDDHEKYCQFKPSNCKYCEWEGPAYQIISHLQKEHPEVTVLLGSTKKYCVLPFNPREKCSIYIPISVGDHFFWAEMKNDPKDDRFTIIVHVVPRGKTVNVFVAEVKFKFQNDCYSTESSKIKLIMDQETEQYCHNRIFVPTSILHKHTEQNKIEYKFFIKINKRESLCQSWNLVKAKYDLRKK